MVALSVVGSEVTGVATGVGVSRESGPLPRGRRSAEGLSLPPREGVAANHLAEPAGAGLGAPLLGGPIDLDETEPGPVAEGPLEVVEQAPVRVAEHVDALVE